MEEGGTRRKNATCKVKNDERKDANKKKETKESTILTSQQLPKDKEEKRNDTKTTKEIKEGGTSLSLTPQQKPKIPNLEERRLSCSRTEFRPIHTEIIRRKLLQDLRESGSLPFNVTEYKPKEDVGDDSPTLDSLADMERFLLRRYSTPIIHKSTKGEDGLDSGIGSSPDPSPKTSMTEKKPLTELMFNIEL